MKGFYKGKEVELNKPMKGDNKKYKIYVDTLNGIKKVEFDGETNRFSNHLHSYQKWKELAKKNGH